MAMTSWRGILQQEQRTVSRRAERMFLACAAARLAVVAVLFVYLPLEGLDGDNRDSFGDAVLTGASPPGGHGTNISSAATPSATIAQSSHRQAVLRRVNSGTMSSAFVRCPRVGLLLAARHLASSDLARHGIRFQRSSGCYPSGRRNDCPGHCRRRAPATTEMPPRQALPPSTVKALNF